jgi:WD40 repeat protein
LNHELKRFKEVNKKIKDENKLLKGNFNLKLGSCYQGSSSKKIIEDSDGVTDSDYSDADIENDPSVICYKKYKQLFSMEEHSKHIDFVIQLDDGNIVTAGKDNLVKVWKDNVCLKTFTNHTKLITGICKLADGSFVTMSKDLSLLIWKDYEVKKTITLTENPRCIISQDEGFICGFNKTIKFYKDGKWENHKRGHTANILVNLGKGSIAAACADNNIKIMEEGEKAKRLKAHTEPIRALLVLKDGKLGSSSEDKNIKIWSENKIFKTLVGHTCSVNCLIQLSDGYLVSGSCDTSIKVWSDYELLTTLKGHTCSVNALVELNQGCFASGSSDKTIKVWRNFNCIKTLMGLTEPVSYLLHLQDDKILSVSGSILKVWG